MRKAFAVIAVCAALAMFVQPALVRGDDKPAGSGNVASSPDADAALAEIKAAQPPQFDQARKGDKEYVQQYRAQMDQLMAKRAELAKGFYDRFPDHPEAAKLMTMRWQILSNTGKGDVVAQETDAAIAKKPGTPIAGAARFAKAQVALSSDRGFDDQMKSVEEFITAEPKDPRGGDLLVQLASYGTDDAAKQREIFTRVQKDYPADSRAAKSATAKMRQVDGVGKPFELSFTDAISGKTIDVQKDLRGKVVVVDFWATWCGPCVGEMPHMKELYSQFKPKGVEFIGISLDQPEDKGGLDALKKFVADNKIEWPQYYQGNFWQSEFSSGWGINSIPALFVVDHDGKLYSTNARGKLEQILPELIAKRDGKAASAR
jgi:thiol-disulfide isomerase/thioredoxin